MLTSTGTIADINQTLNVQCFMPSGLGWDNVNYPVGYVNLIDSPGLNRSFGSIYDNLGHIITAESLFNSKSTALSAPGATFYVATTGSDSNNGLTVGAPFLTMNKAVLAANAAGVPTLIYVAAGVYPRSGTPAGTGLTSPTVDIAFVATGGRVIMGTFDLTWTATQDGTYTNTYSYTTANTDRVLDLLNLDAYGRPAELRFVGSGAAANISSGSWSAPVDGTSGTLYIHRADGAAVTTSNTRVLRTGSGAGCFYFRNQVNVYVGDGGNQSTFPSCGFDCYGAPSTGSAACFDYYISSPSSSITNTIVVSKSNFLYGGGYQNTNGRCFAVDSVNGAVFVFNCDATGAATDGFNFHCANSPAVTYHATINCTSRDNGRGPNNTSCNAYTNHDVCVGIDVAGYGLDCHGGTCRSANNSRYWFCGTLAKGDKGDTVFGGTTPPEAFGATNDVKFWCDRTKVDMPSGTMAYMAEASTSAIYLKNPWPTSASIGGPGTVAAY